MMSRLKSLRSMKDATVANLQASQARIHEVFAAMQGCFIEECARAREMPPYLDFKLNLTDHQREAFRQKSTRRA